MRAELRSEIERVVPGLDGWCPVEKALAMAEVVLAERPRVCVEIGVFGGRSLIPQALALREVWDEDESSVNVEIAGAPERKRGIIYGIDPWKKGAVLEGVNDPKNDEWWRNLDLGAIFATCARCVAAQRVTEHVALLQIGSEEAAPLFGLGGIDILHVDGNHSELSSCRDVTLYLPKVRPGGRIWMDDTNWATTQPAVRMVEAHCDLLRTLQGEGTESRLYRKRS